MTFLEKLVDRAMNDVYLDELLYKLELKYAHIFLYKNLMMY